MYYRLAFALVALVGFAFVPAVSAAESCPAVGNVELLAAGDSHVLAVTQDNSLYAWGANDRGQLGDGTYEATTLTPRLLVPPGDIIMLAAGEAHSMALTADGQLYAWGANESGQLGIGSTNNVNTPTLVMINVVAISAERSQSFAITSSGRLYSWGSNDSGQLGLGDTEQRLSPALVSTLQGVSGVEAGWRHTLAVTDAGDVYAWGSNYFGQVGNGEAGSVEPVTLPLSVQGLPDIKSVSAGSGSSFALSQAGEIFSWGGNSYGSLGFGDTAGRPSPVKIPGLNTVAEISVGTSTVLARLEDGSVSAWGSNAFGKVGVGPTSGLLVHVYLPQLVSEIPAAKLVVSARENSYVVSARDGSIFAWGVNFSDQLLDPSIGSPSVLFPEAASTVSELGTPVMMSAGSAHTLVLDEMGQVWVMGDNYYGQLGLGAEISGTVALVPVPGLDDVIGIAAGHRHSMALRADGELLAWGGNSWGQVSSSTESRVYLPVSVGLAGVTKIASAWTHNLAVTSTGDVYAWGDNAYGQLGIGNNAPVSRGQIVQVSGLQGATSVAAGGYHSHAVLETGQLYSWGDNTFSQLGDGTATDRYSPVLIAGAATDVIAGDHHALLVDVFGEVFGWGNNASGQLGLPSSPPVATPTVVPGVGAVDYVAAGYGHTVVATAAGQILSMGYNLYGQLGLGDTSNRDAASFVGFGDGPVAAGTMHSVVVMIDEDSSEQRLSAFGDNIEGQLGSSRGMRLRPAALAGCEQTAEYLMSSSFYSPGHAYINHWDGLGRNQLSWHDVTSSSRTESWAIGGIASDVRSLVEVPPSTFGLDARVATLTRDLFDRENRVYTFDVGTGARLRTQLFLTEEWNATDLAHLSLGSAEGIAVLAQNETTGEIAVQLRDADSGAFLKNSFFLNSNWRAMDLLVIEGFDVNQGPELGVLGRSEGGGGQIVVMVKDALTNTFIRNVFFLNSNWRPIQVLSLADFTDNGANELALLAENRLTGKLVVMVKDAATNTFVNNVFPLGSGWEPIKMVALPDENANGAQELAVLGVSEASGKLVIQVRDSMTGAFLRNLEPLGSNWTPKDMSIHTDIGGGFPGLSVLATRKSDEVAVVQTLEAVSGELVSNVFLN